MNDSGWITIWLGELAHAIVLVWGAYAVYQHNNPDPNAAGVTLTTGEYYLLLKIFTTVSKHLRKLNTSFVLLQRGAVCLSRVEKLLNLGLPQDVDHTNAEKDAAMEDQIEVDCLVERFDIEPFSDFSAK